MSFWDAVRDLFSEGAAMWGFLSALGIVLILTPLTGFLAHRVGGLDHANDRPRVHNRPIPRIGGLAIVAGILVPAALLVQPEGSLLGIVRGIPCVAAIGLGDDVRGLVPSTKLVA